MRLFLRNIKLTASFSSREQLQRNAREGHFYIKVSMQLLLNFDEHLAMQLRNNPETITPVLESATKKVYQNNYHATIADSESDPVPEWQVQIFSDENTKNLRDLTSQVVGKMVVVPGIITSASRTSIKATEITWRCSSCEHTYKQSIKFGFGGAQAKRQCENAQNGVGADQKSRCPLDPYRIVAEECKFLD